MNLRENKQQVAGGSCLMRSQWGVL